MEGEAPYVWLRPATGMEEFFDSGQRKFLFVTVYGLTLCSAVPLSDYHVGEALLHLFRKVPTLRLCFRKREDTLWACDMNREELDFKVLEEEDPLKVQEELMQYQFPCTEGPLWCARLLPPGARVRCSRPELGTAFPHTRCLMLANHHSIADGTTNNLIVDLFLQLLDDVIANKAINDSTQLGYLSAGEETKALLMAKAAELNQKNGQLQLLVEAKKKFALAEKLIPRTFPLPVDPNFKVQVVIADLDKDMTSKFMKKCKQEGVTVNSGLVALINVGLVAFVQEGGLRQDTYCIHETNAVNMRRYWSEDASKALGCHMLPLQSITSTPGKWQNNFWEHARNVHARFTKNLQEKEAIVQASGSIADSNPEDYFKERSYPECDYGSANMGDLDKIIPTEGEHVRLTYLARTTSCWRDPMYHMFHTLRGCFMYSLTYANDILTREKAQKLVDTILNNVELVAQ